MESVRAKIERGRHLFPAISRQVCEIYTVGVFPEYTGPGMALPRESGSPYDRSKSFPIVKKFRKLIRDGEMMVASDAADNVAQTRRPRPTSSAQKKMPDRPLSVDFRVISDLRIVNLGFDAAQRIAKLKDVPTSLPARVCKRDIGDAFRRVFIRPDLRKLLRRDLDASDVGVSTTEYETVHFPFLALPFGWVGSPIYYALMNESIIAIHADFRPSQPMWSGGELFSCFLYVEDAIWTASPLGSRKDESAKFWEYATWKILGPGAANVVKRVEEGAWVTEQAALGFLIDTIA